jgi:hypothetical protein
VILGSCLGQCFNIGYYCLFFISEASFVPLIHYFIKSILIFNKIFSRDQLRQMDKRNRRFEDHLGLHHQGCDHIVLETSVSFIHLTRLSTREDFIESCRRESFRSYKTMLILSFHLYLGLASGVIRSGFLTEIWCAFLTSPMRVTYPTYLVTLLLVTIMFWQRIQTIKCLIIGLHIIFYPFSSSLVVRNIFTS